MAAKLLIRLKCCICGSVGTTRDYQNKYHLQELRPRFYAAWQICSHPCLDEHHRTLKVHDRNQYSAQAARRGLSFSGDAVA